MHNYTGMAEQVKSDPRMLNEPRLLDQVREKTLLLHMSIRTEKAYVQRIDRFLRFHHERSGPWQHPRTMGNAEVNGSSSS